MCLVVIFLVLTCVALCVLVLSLSVQLLILLFLAGLLATCMLVHTAIGVGIASTPNDLQRSFLILCCLLFVCFVLS
jgi:hypothetical protein